MTTEATTPEAETPAPVVIAEAPAPAKKTRAARPNAGAKAKAKVAASTKGKATAKARTPIPAGMTRSRGALIPVANGQCAIAVGNAQCHNPGRWEATIAGRKVRTCTTHKRANPAKVALFGATKKVRTPKVAATA